MNALLEFFPDYTPTSNGLYEVNCDDAYVNANITFHFSGVFVSIPLYEFIITTDGTHCILTVGDVQTPDGTELYSELGSLGARFLSAVTSEETPTLPLTLQLTATQLFLVNHHHLSGWLPWQIVK